MCGLMNLSGYWKDQFPFNYQLTQITAKQMIFFIWVTLCYSKQKKKFNINFSFTAKGPATIVLAVFICRRVFSGRCSWLLDKLENSCPFWGRGVDGWNSGEHTDHSISVVLEEDYDLNHQKPSQVH